jgi:hypothetical protein
MRNNLCKAGFLLSVSCLLLLGCAQTLWTKSGATVADFEKAKAVCDYQSEIGTPNEHIGYGLSGAVASGISEGIRKGTLMQKCMVADGWQSEQAPTGATLAAVETKKTQIKELVAQRKACVAEIRNHPQYAPLQPHLSDIGTGNFAMAQLADELTPTPSESSLMVTYFDEAKPCVSKFIASAAQLVPAVGPILLQADASNDATILQLIQRKRTWGEAAQQQKQNNAAVQAKINQIRLP